MPQSRAVDEWRSGWPLVLTCLIGIVGSYAPTAALGQFVKPLESEFGWTRTMVTSATLIITAATVILATALGGTIDRVGPRRFALVGVFLAGLAMASVGLTGPAIWTWWMAWTAFAVAGLTLGPLTWTPALTRHFNASRGLALSVGYSGSGVGAFVWPPLALWLIQTFGWRGAFFAIGGLIAFVVTPTVFVFFRGRATGPVARTSSAEGPPPGGMTLGQALGTSIFWRVTLVLMATAAAVSSISVHLPALLNDGGIPPVQAALITAAIGPSLIVGRLAGGALLDLVHARWVMGSFLILPAIACALLFNYDGSYARGIAAAVLAGLTLGVEGDLLAYLLSRYFGLRNSARIYGAGLSVFILGFGGGPTAMAFIFDSLGSYDAFLGLVGVVMLVCVAVGLTLGRYPHFAPADTAAPAR